MWHNANEHRVIKERDGRARDRSAIEEGKQHNSLQVRLGGRLLAPSQFCDSISYCVNDVCWCLIYLKISQNIWWTRWGIVYQLLPKLLELYKITSIHYCNLADNSSRLFKILTNIVNKIQNINTKRKGTPLNHMVRSQCKNYWNESSCLYQMILFDNYKFILDIRSSIPKILILN